jgi:hypothetical protein
MGQYRFSAYLGWQIGLCVSINDYCITISIPFINIYIATTKEAKGFSVFDLLISKNKM